MRIDLRFTRQINPANPARPMVIELSFDRGSSWEAFGDPLPAFPDDFDFHDIYHLVFKARLGFSHVFDHLFFEIEKKDRPFLQEEAVVLNDFMDPSIRSGIPWCCGMFPKDVRPEEMDLTLDVCRQLVADLRRQHAEKGFGRALVWMPDANFEPPDAQVQARWRR